MQTLLKDFNSCWGDEYGIMTYKKDPRCQPQGFRPDQVRATALDPWCKVLYGAPDIEDDGVRRAMAETAADITLARNRQRKLEREARSRQTTPSGPVSKLSQHREFGRKDRTDQD